MRNVGLRKIADYALATSAAAAAAAAAAACVCSVLYGSHAKAINRCHVRGACCAVRVWRGQTPQSPGHDHFFR